MNILSNTRLLRYLGVATAIVGIELVFFQLIFLLSGNYMLATVLSFSLAIILNWILSRKLVFGASHHHKVKEFLLVLGASLVGLAIQLAVVYISVEVLRLYPLIGKVLSIGFSFFWNYWFRAAVIFRKAQGS
jgi:putative flippase GtrA